MKSIDLEFMTNMGEYAVGACLRFHYNCSVVSYNRRVTEDPRKFAEINVIGVDSSNKIVHLCDVTTHLEGMLYGSDNRSTLKRMKKKLVSMKSYGEKTFKDFKRRYMVWSPYVPRGALIEGLQKIGVALEIDLELVINKKYKKLIIDLWKKAEIDLKDYVEPFFRVLQIITHLKSF